MRSCGKASCIFDLKGPSNCDQSLCLAIPDRGERQAAVLCGAAPAAGYVASGSRAGSNRGGA